VTAVFPFIVMTTMLSAPAFTFYRDKHREASAAGGQQERDDDVLKPFLLSLFSAHNRLDENRQGCLEPTPP
jgi:hypothetical protein